MPPSPTDPPSSAPPSSPIEPGIEPGPVSVSAPVGRVGSARRVGCFGGSPIALVLLATCLGAVGLFGYLFSTSMAGRTFLAGTKARIGEESDGFSWREVATYSGTDNLTAPAFTATKDWRIRWVTVPKTPGYRGIFVIFVGDQGAEAGDDLGIATGEGEAAGLTAGIGPGEHRLRFLTDQGFTVTLEERE